MAKSCWSVAPRNHGKSVNARKNSRPPTSSQKPCGDTFRTSTLEMSAPMFADFILSFLYNFSQLAQFRRAETLVDRQFNFRLQPEFRLTVRRNHRSEERRVGKECRPRW